YRDVEVLGKPIGGLLCKNQGIKCYLNEDLAQNFKENEFLPLPVTRAEEMEKSSFCSSGKTSCLFWRVFHEGKDIEGEMEMYRKDGSKFSAHLSLSNLVDSNGGPLGITAIIRDLTKEKEIEASMKQLDRLTILGELMASLAHEIKNPLAGIQGALEVLDEYFGEGDFRKEISGEILGQFKRLDKVIMDLLNFSKIRKPDFGLVKIDEILEISLFLVNKQLKEREIHLSQEISPELPFVLADSEQLQQVFLNLLLNAIQAVPESGLIKVSAATAPEDKEYKDINLLRVIIQDNGMGISPENISKIFNPFFTTKPKGTGLGLSIVQNIMAQHKGRIEVKSELKAGTTIILEFPIANNERV
ncbi:MAG: PAS domain S-box protein, partial [Candidatus Tectomicrobia bacterium]|nr:PAS domain S-box protein [Candidatus Tectomicrobia bacterium]